MTARRAHPAVLVTLKVCTHVEQCRVQVLHCIVVRPLHSHLECWGNLHSSNRSRSISSSRRHPQRLLNRAGMPTGATRRKVVTACACLVASHLAHAERVHGMEAVHTQQDGFRVVTLLVGMPAAVFGHHRSWLRLLAGSDGTHLVGRVVLLLALLYAQLQPCKQPLSDW